MDAHQINKLNEWYERQKKCQKLNLVCICGHKDNRHADIDDGSRFGDWGVGHCELCDCRRFKYL